MRVFEFVEPCKGGTEGTKLNKLMLFDSGRMAKLKLIFVLLHPQNNFLGM
jgi:hypothetical protein